MNIYNKVKTLNDIINHYELYHDHLRFNLKRNICKKNITMYDVDDHCELISAHHVPGEILPSLFEYLFIMSKVFSI